MLLRFSLYKNKGTDTVCQVQYAPIISIKNFVTKT